MEIRIQTDRNFGDTVSSWFHEKKEGPLFSYVQEIKKVWFTWKDAEEGIIFTWLPVTIQNREDITEIKEIIRREFSEYGAKLKYMLPLVHETFLVARILGYFDHLDEELVDEMVSDFGHSRRWFTCYGFLALDLPLGVVELLVPPIKITPGISCIS